MKPNFKLFDNQVLRSEITDVIMDRSSISNFKTLKNYLAQQKKVVDPAEFDLLISKIKKSISQQLTYYSFLTYYLMEKKNDWQEAGEAQSRTTFTRLLLKKTAEEPITYEDTLEFNKQLQAQYELFGFHQMSIESAAAEASSFGFEFFGRKFMAVQTEEITRMMHFCGVNWFLQGGLHGQHLQFILGSGRLVHKGGYDVVTLEKEFMRTPNNIVAMAAVIGHRQIYVRMESLRVIFDQKWRQLFRYRDYELSYMRHNPMMNISDGIKRHATALYGATSLDTINSVQDQFVKDMSETILYHELGHGAVQHDVLSVEGGTLGEASRVYGENIYTQLLEFLADFVSVHGEIWGPMANMCKIAKKDRARAERMFYIYFSDTWFYDTDDTYMYLYTDLMALVLLRYVNDDRSVDFAKLEADIQFDKAEVATHNTMYGQYIKMVETDMDIVKTWLENSEMTIGGKVYDYKKARQILMDQFKKNDGYVHTESYEFQAIFWNYLYRYIKSYSPETFTKISNLLETREQEIIRFTLELSGGKNAVAEYDGRPRDYIVDRMTQLGILGQVVTQG